MKTELDEKFKELSGFLLTSLDLVSEVVESNPSLLGLSVLWDSLLSALKATSSCWFELKKSERKTGVASG